MNILFIMTDQQRADHVGWAGDARLATPNLDRLAEGCVFDRAYSVNPVCTPCRSALLTGKYSHQVGMLQMSGDLSPQHPTWPRALQGAGYHTMGIGKFHWLQGWPWGTPHGAGHDLVALEEQLRDFGWDRVWEASGKQLAGPNHCHWGAQLAAKGVQEAYRRHIVAEGPNRNEAVEARFTGEPWPFAEEDQVDIATCDAALRALDERPRDRPFALFCSFCSPHPPFDPSARFLDAVPLEEVDDFIPEEALPLDDATRQRLWRLRRAYRAMIACVDEQVGRLLDRLAADGLLEETVICFTSDHGEMLGDHGRLQKQSWYEQSVRVPTAIRHPRHLDGRRCATPIEVTDLTATILACAGLDPQQALSKPWPAFHDRVPCRSLLPVLAGEADGVRDLAFSAYGGQWQMVCDGRYKLVRTCVDGRLRLIDLVEDPQELGDCAATHPGITARLDGRLRAILDATPVAQLQWAPYGPRVP